MSFALSDWDVIQVTFGRQREIQPRIDLTLKWPGRCTHSSWEMSEKAWVVCISPQPSLHLHLLLHYFLFSPRSSFSFHDIDFNAVFKFPVCVLLHSSHILSPRIQTVPGRTAVCSALESHTHLLSLLHELTSTPLASITHLTLACPFKHLFFFTPTYNSLR